MRICVSGTSGQGKTTFINDFLEEWPMYTTPEKTYRDLLKRTHSKKTTKDIQWKILNSMIDELQSHTSDECIIYDRGPIDNIAYSIWSNSMETGKIDDEFVNKCITLVKQSMSFIDIIFFTPITKFDSIEYDTERFEKRVKSGLTDETYRQDIDNILKALKRDWDINGESKFFDPHDKPAFIEIFGEPRERLEMAKLYIDADGDILGGENSMEDLLTPELLAEAEMYKQQLGVEDSQSEAYKNAKGLNK